MKTFAEWRDEVCAEVEALRKENAALKQRITRLPNCETCGNVKCSMQAGVCGKWQPVK